MDQNQGVLLRASVDGKDLQNLDSYRVQSPAFGFTFPSKNVFNAPPGPTKAVADGWYILLPPMKPGMHNIHFVGSNVANPTTGTQSYVTEVIYNLLVK